MQLKSKFSGYLEVINHNDKLQFSCLGSQNFNGKILSLVIGNIISEINCKHIIVFNKK